MEQRNSGDDGIGEKVVTDLVFSIALPALLRGEVQTPDSRVVEKDVFVVCGALPSPHPGSPPWVGGFKPGLAFRIVDAAVGG